MDISVMHRYLDTEGHRFDSLGCFLFHCFPVVAVAQSLPKKQVDVTRIADLFQVCLILPFHLVVISSPVRCRSLLLS